MSIKKNATHGDGRRKSRLVAHSVPVAFAAALAGLGASPVTAGDREDDGRDHKHSACSSTAAVMRKACRAEALDDYLVETANCLNFSDADEVKTCKKEAVVARKDAGEECADQFEARLEVCDALPDQGPYDPDFDPASFVNPLEIGSSVAPNPFFPLVPGNGWVYESTFTDEEGEEVTETITVTVTDKTKLIEGVTCLVVNDLVEEDGAAIEDTDDWYAQDIEGNVWYCGEIAKNFENFEGDEPEEPELVDIEGSWKAGRDSAKPGILMLAYPQVGDVYRQEVAWGDAEDVAEVLDTAGSESVPVASCSGDCVVTRDYSALEPGIYEHKFYAPGIGLILEVDMEGNRVELVELIQP